MSNLFILLRVYIFFPHLSKFPLTLKYTYQTQNSTVVLLLTFLFTVTKISFVRMIFHSWMRKLKKSRTWTELVGNLVTNLKQHFRALESARVLEKAILLTSTVKVFPPVLTVQWKNWCSDPLSSHSNHLQPVNHQWQLNVNHKKCFLIGQQSWINTELEVQRCVWSLSEQNKWPSGILDNTLGHLPSLIYNIVKKYSILKNRRRLKQKNTKTNICVLKYKKVFSQSKLFKKILFPSSLHSHTRLNPEPFQNTGQLYIVCFWTNVYKLFQNQSTAHEYNLTSAVIM